MALFHLSVTQTKRSAGQSAIASAAYRAGERLYSEYYGEYKMCIRDRFKTVRDDLHRLWKVKSCVDTAARFNERTEEQLHQNRPQTRHKKEDISR